MSNPYTPRVWNDDSVPTATDFNRIERGVRALVPQVLWNNPAGLYTVGLYSAGQTGVVSQAITNFTFLEFVIRDMWLGNTNLYIHVMRTPTTFPAGVRLTWGGGESSDTDPRAFTHVFEVRFTSSTAFSINMNKVVGIYSGTAAHAQSLNTNQVSLVSIRGIHRIAG